MKLYIGNKNYSSWSLRPWLLMQELALPFEEHLVPFEDEGTYARFRAFSPTGRVPCLHDGDVVVWDSLAIAEYLAERHPEVWPAAASARAFARCAAAEMHAGFSALRSECPMSCGVRARLTEVTAGLTKDLARLEELWGEGLRRFGGPFLGGETFTAVDAFFAPVAFRAQTYALALSDAAARYVATLLARPGMQRWYAAALQERWRDAHDERPPHATLIEDLRAPPR
ncbi:MAG: glutathione S-transferase family protein [Kofleriaceae bacterium]